MLQVGDIIRLRGISQKGKNRVREHGEMWRVHHPVQFVIALNKQGFCVTSPDGDWRWIAVENDSHFEWELF